MDLNIGKFAAAGNDDHPDIQEITANEIAIIGMAAKIGSADTVDEFWDFLKNGVDCITGFPSIRRNDIDDYLGFLGITDGEPGYIQSAFLKEIDKFDYGFFRISPKEAGLMDPNQRLFLETAWAAIEEAGYGGNQLVGSRTGVFVGFTGESAYKKAIAEIEPAALSIAFSSNIESIIAGRISFMLDLKGPSLLVDTACSSSLTAVHLACQALKNGDCDLALAGSTKIILLPLNNNPVMGIESSDGRTRSFDDDSDGTGNGEGVAAILLKPLKKALKDGDHIHAIIKGSAINQDGNSIGITAPNAAAQEDVIVRAWERARVDPETITYIEAHGTGTRLGDPIEVDGIQRAFRRFTNKKQFCGLGTVKTNMGHLGHAAGMAGLIKAVLALKHKQIPPSLHFYKPNVNIDFKKSPVYVHDMLAEWEVSGFPRRCGVSSFGLSGTNCHLVLEEAPAPGNQKETDGKEVYFLAISAKSRPALLELVKQYQTMPAHDEWCLGDICYTANTGRGHYTHRLALVFRNRMELREKFAYVIDNFEILPEKTGIKQDLYYGEHSIVPENKEFIAANEITESLKVKLGKEAGERLAGFKQPGGNRDRILAEICRLYIKGADLNWAEFYRGERHQKLSLPVYPFERKRCWLEIPENSKLAGIEFSLKRGAQAGNDYDLAGREAVDIQGGADGAGSPIEAQVWQIIGKVLGYKTLNIYDNFYELGGDSIFAARIVNLINKTFKINVKVSEMLKHPMIADFSSCIRELCAGKLTVDSYPPIVPVPLREYYPLSSAQKRLYILERQFEQGNTSYNMTQLMILEGEPDLQRVSAVFQELIRRHEAFRTSFTMVNGEPVQRIEENVDYRIDFREASEEECAEIITGFIKPFDLSKVPLLRVCLIRFAPCKHLLLLDMHHIISDGITLSIIMNEFIRLYGGETLPSLTIQYKDYAVWQAELIQTALYKKQEDYWLNQFKDGIPELNLPTDFPRPALPNYEGAKLFFEFDGALTQALYNLCRTTKTTLNMILLASYYILLSKLTGREDIVIGTVIAGRPDADLENIIGMFVNTQALRNYPTSTKKGVRFIEEVKNSTLKALENQDYQFEQLVEKLNIPRKINQNPIFDVMFVMQNLNPPKMNPGNLKHTPYPFENKVAKFDLTLQAEAGAGKIFGSFEYRACLFQPKTIERMAGDYLKIAAALCENPETLLSGIELAPDTAKAKNLRTREVQFDF